MYVGISALILSAFSTVCMFFGIYSVNLWLDIVLIVVNTIVAIILLIGIYYEKAWMMVPFIITEILQCILFFSLASYTLYYLFRFKQDRFRRFDQILMVISIYVGIVICGSAIWAAAKCFHYLKDKEKNSSETTNQPERRPTLDTSIHVECGINGTGYWL